MKATTATGSRSKVLTPWSKQAAVNAPVIVRGKGSFLFDDADRRYLDLSAGLVAVNMGHGHPAISGAIARQAASVAYVAPSLQNDRRSELAELLSECSPWAEGGRTFFSTGGGEGNEDAVKMARLLTGRLKVMTAYRSFHGSAPGAGSMTGEDRRWANEPGMPGVVRFFAPYPYRSPFHTTDPEEEVRRALDHVEQVLMFEGAHNVAALVIEPLVGSNGVVSYPDGYLKGLREITARHGILLVFDEVMTGFGRLGEWFAAARYGVEPDMITFAKGVTSAYVPLGGALVRESLASHFDEAMLPLGHTYSGHPVAMAAGVANMRAMRDEGVLHRARELEPVIRKGLAQLAANHAVIGDVRGEGAMFGIELVRDRASREPLVPWYGGNNAPMGQLSAVLRDEGVYAFGRYNVLIVTPPLVVTEDELELGFAALDRALARVAPDWS